MSASPIPPGHDPLGRVLDRLLARRLVRAALVLLALLYASAIYAPLLANDRPYVLEAVDRGGYERARKALPLVALSLRTLACEGEAAYLARRTQGSTQGFQAALAAERGALRDRVAVLRDALAPTHRAPLAELERRADELLARPASDAAGPCPEGDALVAAARRARDGLAPRSEAAPDGAELVGRTRYPLLASLSGVEVGLMGLWALLLAWPLWSRLVDRRLAGKDPGRRRRLRPRKALFVLAASLALGLVWHLAVGGETSLPVAGYKEGLSGGDVVARRVVFPPLAYGFAETHKEEQFRPPTWTRAAEISPEGRYVHGPRAGREGERAPAANPVVVRAGEPAANDPWRHPLGTDGLGRDLLARLLWGGRVSLAVGCVSTALLLSIGVAVGALAGYLGGRVDLLVSRLIEVVLCFPVFFLVLAVVTLVGPSILNVMVVIGCLRWTGVARLTRGELLRLREQDFVVAARALGLSHVRIVLRHLLPNALGPLLVAASFSLAAGILIESGVSFLGFGIEAPIPSWGALLTESRSAAHWWIQVFPGGLIFLTVLATNLVGDALRDALDPRSAP